jgi:hypothetical protein
VIAEAWKLSLEEKAHLLEDAARWKASSYAWEKEATKHARENAVLRNLLRRRLQLIIEALPEIA